VNIYDSILFIALGFCMGNIFQLVKIREELKRIVRKAEDQKDE